MPSRSVAVAPVRRSSGCSRWCFSSVGPTMSSSSAIWSTLFQTCLRMKKSPSLTCVLPSRIALAANSFKLHHTPVADAYALGADLEDEALVAREELLGELQELAQARLQLADVGQRHQRLGLQDATARDLGDLAADAALDQPVKVEAVQVLRQRAHQEPVEDRAQGVVVGHLVGRAVERAQRHLDARAAGEELPLVQDAEQRVQDRGVRLEDLVEEHDLRLGQHRLDAPDVAALAEGLDVDRAEDLVGLGEARQQIFEVTRVDQARQVAHQRRLGGAGRTDDQHVLARHQRDQQHPHQLGLVQVALVQLAADIAQLVAQPQHFGVEGQSEPRPGGVTCGFAHTHRMTPL